jgi:thiamine-phosphate pyrophosphorylase
MGSVETADFGCRSMSLTRIYLITPRDIDLALFPGQLADALGGGDVASLLIAPEGVSEMALQRIAEVLTPIAQAAGVAAIVRDDTRASSRAKADGIHVETGIADIREAVGSFHPQRFVGAGHILTRHDAMEAAEANADYIFFGLIDRPEEPDAHPKSLDFADWWVPLFEPPCVVMAGSTLGSIDAVAETGADFVAVRDSIWLDPRGPRAAIEEAERRLAEVRLSMGV